MDVYEVIIKNSISDIPQRYYIFPFNDKLMFYECSKGEIKDITDVAKEGFSWVFPKENKEVHGGKLEGKGLREFMLWARENNLFSKER